MRLGAVEVHRSRAPFEAGGKSFPAGSHVILMAQPFSGFAKSLLERQHYPDQRQWPGGPPQRPYDVTAHTLPLLMGVDVVAEEAPFAADLEKVDTIEVAPGTIERGRGRFLALGHKNGEMVALGRLLRAGVPVRWTTAAFLDRNRNFRPGTLLVPDNARARLEPMAKELGVEATPVSATVTSLLVRKPRVGLYQSWVPSMDEGWTRFIFEKQLGIDYETLHDKDVRAGGLRARFDAIVLPDQPRRAMVNGNAPETVPPEYVGGLGKEGVQSLKSFVEEGGTLVALDSASEMPIAEFGLPVTNVLAAFNRDERRGEDEGDAGGKDFYCPGRPVRAGGGRQHEPAGPRPRRDDAHLVRGRPGLRGEGGRWWSATRRRTPCSQAGSSVTSTCTARRPSSRCRSGPTGSCSSASGRSTAPSLEHVHQALNAHVNVAARPVNRRSRG
jgi:hypothetical protein